MDHINLFQTNAEFSSAYTNNYVEPWVSYTRETSGMSFNKKSGPTPPPVDYRSMPLTIEITAGTGTITFDRAAIKYKVNDEEWTSGDTPTISVSSGDKIQVKQDYSASGGDGSGAGHGDQLFSATASLMYIIYGNIMSIYTENGFESATSLTVPAGNLFSYLGGLTSAENLVLPATTLVLNCYEEMFKDCTFLTTAPLILPAETLTQYCYQNMFAGCTSLTAAPSLPAIALAHCCYYYMFSGCTSLATVPSNYLPATTLATSCYDGMFNNCTSLTTAPDLPAETLVDLCYSGMFNGCINLNYIKCLATDISAFNCTNYWVNGVPTGPGGGSGSGSGSGSVNTFVKSPNMDSWPTGPNGIPLDWIIENAS